MKTPYIVIGYGQLALAFGLMVANFGLSIYLRLGLTRSLLIASVRMVCQLLLVGFILEWLFEQDNPVMVVAIALGMTVIAGTSAVGRTKRKFAGIYWNSIVSMLVAAAIVSQISLHGIIKVDPWYDPQYFVPILGMVLGNILNGVSLGMDRFLEDLVNQRDQVEMLLAHGASRWESCQSQVRNAVRTGMIPTINSMMIVGIVSLPGMMTGQILAGTSPIDAVRYQIVILFMMASGTALGTMFVVVLAFLRLMGADYRLRLEDLTS